MTYIKGNLCELRVLERSDEEAKIFTRYVNAGLTTEHLLTGSIPMRSIDIQEVWDDEHRKGSIEFGIWAKENGVPKFVGTAGLYSHRDIYMSWEFRILIFDDQFVSRGIGSEATALVVDYGFKRMNAHRIWLGVSALNIRAIKCYLSCGFVEEGRLREDLFTYGGYVDAVRMGILVHEWGRLKGEAEKAKLLAK